MTPPLTMFRSSNRKKRLSTSFSLMPKKSWLPNIFNAIRLGTYIAILVWTVICLAISIHFQGILVSSDLTHFVPFAIFVSVASLLVILVLIISTIFRQRNPISTRIELACLGLLGVLWLALGSFLAASAAAEADVECFSTSSTTEDPVEYPGFTTDIFHAQYRVLEAFSIFNLILVWCFLLLLLFLAFREHRKGYRKVWIYAVPVYPWFNNNAHGPYSNHHSRNKSLPVPVTAKNQQRRKDSTRRPAGKSSGTAQEKPQVKEYRKSAFWVWVDRPREVPAARTRDRPSDRRKGEPSSSRRTHGTYGNAYGHAQPTRK